MKTDRKTMLSVLATLRPGVATKDVVENATSFTFRGGLAWSHNDEVAVSHPLPEGLDLEGIVVADPLLKLLGKLPDETVDVSTNGNGALIVAGKRGEATIPLKKVEGELLVDAIPMPEGKWSPVKPEFLDALSLAAGSASTDMSRASLTCVSVQKGRVVACDNYRLTVCPVKTPGEWLLPASSVKWLKEFKPTSVATVPGWIHFGNDADCILSVRAGSGEYPNVDPLLKGEGVEIQFPAGVMDALDRAGIFAETEFDNDARVALACAGGKLTVLGYGPQGRFEERMKMSGPDFSLSAHPDYLLSALKLGTKVLLCKGSMRLEGEGFIHVVAL